MDQLIAQFLTIPNLILCFMIGLVVDLQKKGLEILFKRFFKKLYKDIGRKTSIYMMLPLLTGAIFGLVLSFTKFPWPEMVSSRSIQWMFALFLGGASGFVYRFIRKMLAKQESTIEESTTKVTEKVKETTTEVITKVNPGSSE